MIHTAQTVIGGAFLAIAASVVVNPLIPETSPIKVHGLEFDGTQMVQSRTVTTDGDKFFAKWSAQIEDSQTGDIVCQGSGSWNYSAGYLDASMPLQVWVGDDACTFESLPNGRYTPIATWYWGSDQVSYTGKEFEKR